MNGLILEVLKSPTPYFWPKLYSKFTNPSHKPRIWWELQQKQDESVQKYMGLLEIDESEIEVSSYVKKRSSKNEFNRKDSDIEFVLYFFTFSIAMREVHIYLVVGTEA